MNEYEPNFSQEPQEPIVTASMPAQEEVSKKKTKHMKIKKQKKEKKAKQPKPEKEQKGSILLYVLGSVVLPYLFILFMGLLDQMNILRANVRVIIGISVILFVAMIAMAIRCGRMKKKKATA